MARDWRKVALAVLAAAAVASVCALGPRVAAQQVARAGKAPAKSPAAAKKDDGDEDEDKQPAKKKRQDPAEAQRTIEAANKLLQAGKAGQAAQSLTAVLAGGNLPPATMAKALFVRGMAYRQESKPAQAISDLTSALWLKGGLTADDRKEALKQRAGAYADAGLTENGEIATGSTSGASKERPPAKGWGVTTTPSDNTAPSTTQTAEGGNWFKNWFNNWSPSQAQANSAPPTASIEKSEPPPPERPPPARTQHPPSAARVATAWSSSTQVHADAPPAAASTPKPPHEAPDGKYRVQLATVRSHQEALALAAKAKRALAGALAAREPEIDQAVLGNMGAFYRVRVGPFATVQETQAVCAKVKGAGFDCLTVTQ